MVPNQVTPELERKRSSDRRRQPDEELIGRFAAGDTSAFNVIFARYYMQIYRFISKQTECSDCVEDLVQEVLLRVFKSARTFDISRKFSGWIYMIALNEVKRHWKRYGSRRAFSLNVPAENESSDSECGDFIEDQRIAPEAYTEQQLLSRGMKSLIEGLPEKQKTVVLLKVYNELTYEKIAEICNCPLSTVLSRMRYAVNNIRRRLEKAKGGSVAHHPQEFKPLLDLQAG